MAKQVIERHFSKETERWEVLKKDTSSTKKSKKTGGKDDSSGLSSASNDKQSAKGKTTQKVNKKTLRALEGEAVILPLKKNIDIQVGDTVKMSGLGKYLSGKYYVSGRNITIGNNAFSLSLNLLKTNFRKQIKISAKNK